MIQLKVRASSCHQQQQAQDSLEIGFNSVRVWTLNTCPCVWMVLHDITDKFSVWLQQRLGRFDTSALVEKSPLPAALSHFPPAQTHLTSSQFMKKWWQSDVRLASWPGPPYRPMSTTASTDEGAQGHKDERNSHSHGFEEWWAPQHVV